MYNLPSVCSDKLLQIKVEIGRNIASILRGYQQSSENYVAIET